MGQSTAALRRVVGNWIAAAATRTFRFAAGTILQGAFADLTQALTFGAAVAWDLSLGATATVTATSNAAHTISAPINAVVGQIITLTIANASGGAIAVTAFNAAFHTSAAIAAIADTTNRSITFRVVTVSAAGVVTLAYELYRTAADVAN